MPLAFLWLLFPAAAAQRFPWGTLKLEPWGSGVRLRAWPPGAPLAPLAVQALLPAPPPTTLPVAVGNASVRVGDLLASVDARGMTTFARYSTGAPLLAQTGAAFGAPAAGAAAGSASTALAFAGLQPGERVYGLGEHPGAAGKTEFASSWALEMNGEVTIPFFFSTLGYGLSYNVPAYGNVSISAASHVWASDATPCADLWVTAAEAGAALPAASVMSHYADAVGHAPVMPWAATGFWQSKNRYRNQSQLLAVARGFAERAIPLSIIVIDYLSWEVLGDDTLTPQCWPDPQGMLVELAALNVTVLISLYPYQNEGSRHYDEFVKGGLSAVYAGPGKAEPYNGCLGGQTLYDAFLPAARNATFSAFVEGYARFAPAKGPQPWVWEDCSEPGRSAAGNGKWRFSAGMDSEVGPAWTREHARMVAEGYAARLGPADAAAQILTLSRSFYPGTAALGVVMWGGDVNTDFATLYQSIRVVQQASMSGVALWASDTGGYHGGNVTDPEFNELLVRWTQFSALSPIFRYHGKRTFLHGVDSSPCGVTNGDNEVWAYLPEAQAAILKAMALRESLRGYVLAQSAATAATGLPMVLPVALAFPGDAAAQDPAAEAAYMFGPTYLVQPVAEYGARNASVYLPSGSAWVYYFDRSQRWEGGQTVSVAAPLEEFPLFERA